MTTTALEVTWERERNWLGYAGLLPFLGGTVFLLLDPDPAYRGLAVDVLRYYAAVIASFLGAVHWGAAAIDPANRRARLRWGVTPALIAWTLLLLPPSAAFAGFAALFAAVLYVDWRLLPLLDDRYRRMRLRLSMIVIATLMAAATLSSRAAA